MSGRRGRRWAKPLVAAIALPALVAFGAPAAAAMPITCQAASGVVRDLYAWAPVALSGLPADA